jgi:hypothetical protein
VHAGGGRRREPRQRRLAVAVGALGSDVRWWRRVPYARGQVGVVVGLGRRRTGEGGGRAGVEEETR